MLIKNFKLLLVCLLFSLTVNAQFNMPSFLEVTRTFFSKYSFTHYEEGASYLQFQRKKNGWYVTQCAYDKPGENFNTTLFWSADTRSYKDIDYVKSDGDTSGLANDVDRYLRQIDWGYEEYSFQRNKYYGYPGWDWDIIREAETQRYTKDTLLEGCGRAYSSYATGFISDQYGAIFINNDDDRQLLKETDLINKNRLDKFLKYESEAIGAYTKLLQVNPQYETKVGNVQIKLANEYMFIYSTLLMAGDSIRANEYASKASYPDSLLNLCKSYLSAVPLNSILITGGDNDTYPVWYLQSVQRLRTDVIVLNSSLLGLRRYLTMIDATYHHQLFSTTSATYLQKSFNYAAFSNDKGKEDTISVSLFLKNLKANYNPYRNVEFAYLGDSIKTYYTKNLFFSTTNGDRSKVFQIRGYLLMDAFMILDIINTRSKVYFTYENELINSLLKKNGVVYKVQL